MTYPYFAFALLYYSNLFFRLACRYKSLLMRIHAFPLPLLSVPRRSVANYSLSFPLPIRVLRNLANPLLVAPFLFVTMLSLFNADLCLRIAHLRLSMPFYCLRCFSSHIFSIPSRSIQLPFLRVVLVRVA